MEELNMVNPEFSEIITEKLVEKVLSLITEKTSFKRDSINYELQDGFQQLLISIQIDKFPAKEPSSTFKEIGKYLNTIMPKRKGEYSWMVVFTRAGNVVDSYFGGNIDSLGSGM